MAASDSILSIDVGAWSVKVGEFENSSSGIELKDFGYAEYTKPITDENRTEQVAKALEKVIAEKNFTAKKANISISGQLAFIRFVKLPPIEEDESRVRQVVEFEARQNVPFEMDEVIWDYQLIGGGEEELNVMFVVIKNNIIDSISSAVESVNISPKVIDIAPCAFYNSARANAVGQDSCVMLLNIGSRCSNLIFVDGEQYFCRNIPIAGHTISQQIAKEFGIGLDEAEELKQRHGFVALGGAYEEPESEVAATISKIVRNVLTRLHGEINRSVNIYRSQQKGNKPTKLFLAGGSSIMPYTENFFEEKLRIETEYLNVFHPIKLGSKIERQTLAEKAHLFAEVIGLALRAFNVCPVEISLVPDAVKDKEKFKEKMIYFYGIAVTAILFPLVMMLSASTLRNHFEKQVEKFKPVVNKQNNQKNIIQANITKANEIKEEIKVLQRITQRRSEWTNIFNLIHKSTPPGVWISKIEKGEPAVQDTGKKKKKKTGGGIFGPTNEADKKIAKHQDATKVQAKDQEVDVLYISGYAIKNKDNDKIQHLPSQFLRDLKIHKNVIMITDATDVIESDKVGENLWSFKIRLTLFKPLSKAEK